MYQFENIKLVIWDLDETFWKGTFSEGPVDVPQENVSLLKNLTDCGIVNSICSKNDAGQVMDFLREANLSAFFVFPSVDWTPKGSRIKQLISDMQLRPANVLFLDDNPSNLGEAEHFCPEIMTGLLRNRLGFNGMVVTDASHMVGMTNRMKRADMLPKAINAGCDMFLFFNDPEEDFAAMLNAYKTGIISEERITEALTRILGLKAAKGMHKKGWEELCGSNEALAEALQNPEFKAVAPAISRDCLTLVKYKDADVLPLSPEKTKRVMIVNIKGPDSPMMKLAAIAMGGGKNKKTPVERFCEKLQAKGFDAFIYESPLDKMMKEAAEGKPFNLNLYFAGKNAIADFVSGMDLVISFFDVGHGHPVFGMSKGGGEIPWYVHEIPVVGISVNKPTMLADTPMLRTYINAYDSNEDTMDALVDALLEGPAAFKGIDPIDSYCGMWDTHM